ncbi:MAG: nucleotidyltransferase family protein [Bryobacterales bacterium]|nr:nucleotidyltransferase family protein [Bryobacterales bacterium]
MLQLGEVQVESDKLAEICRQYGVSELSLFGSAVRGEMRPDSDIDVLVEFKPSVRIGLFRFESLSEDLGVLVGRKVDLVTKRGLKPWIRPQVLQEARVVYAA